MVKYLAILLFSVTVVVVSGCVNVKVDEPLVDMGEPQRQSSPVRGEPADEEAKIQWLRGQLARCQGRLGRMEDKSSKLEREKDRLEDKLDSCENEYEELEEKNEDLRKRLKR